MEREYKRSRKYIRKDDHADKVFMRTIRRSMFSMILCTVCLISSTWAWFVASAESQVSVIRLGEATLTVKREGETGENTIRQSLDGAFKLSKGEYIISVEPLTGTAPMYCVIDIETEHTPEERAEREYEDFRKEMEEMGEEWYPVYATDSNAILLLDDENVNDHIDHLAEESDIDYQILSVDVVNDGTYRVDWAPGKDRVFLLELSEKAYVTFEIFWLTDDEAEDAWPGLEEMSSSLNMLVYQAEKTTPGDAAAETSAAEESTTTSETTAAEESTTAAAETSPTEESTTAAETTPTEESTTAAETTAAEESTTAAETTPAEEHTTTAAETTPTVESANAESSSAGDQNTVILVEGLSETSTETEGAANDTPSGVTGGTPEPDVPTEDFVG